MRKRMLVCFEILDSVCSLHKHRDNDRPTLNIVGTLALGLVYSESHVVPAMIEPMRC